MSLSWDRLSDGGLRLHDSAGGIHMASLYEAALIERVEELEAELTRLRDSVLGDEDYAIVGEVLGMVDNGAA